MFVCVHRDGGYVDGILCVYVCRVAYNVYVCVCICMVYVCGVCGLIFVSVCIFNVIGHTKLTAP